MKSDYREENSETANVGQEQKSDYYKPLALLVIFVGIVAFSYLRNWRSASGTVNQEQTGSTARGKSGSDAPESGGENPSGEKQTVKLISKTDQIIAGDDGQIIIGLSENTGIAYRVGTPEYVILKNYPPNAFRSADFLLNREVVIGGENTVGIWNLTDGEKRLSLEAPGGVETVAASRDGLMVAGVARDDGRVWVWDARTGKLLKTSKGDKNSLRPSIYFETPTTLKALELSESRGRIIHIDIASMKISEGAWNEIADPNLFSLKFAVGGKLLEVGSSNRELAEPELLVCDGNTAAEAGKIKMGEAGSGAMINDRIALTVSGSGSINLTDVLTGKIVKLFDLGREARLMATSRDGTTAVIRIGVAEVVVLPRPPGN